MNPFASRIAEGMRRQGITLRGLCRAAGLDPSFFSKVLAGKRSPPADEVLRKMAQLLDINEAELIVSAGRIPEEWQALWRDPALFRAASEQILEAGRLPTDFRSGISSRDRSVTLPRVKTRPVVSGKVSVRQDLAEELL